MTESEWLKSKDGEAMLAVVGDRLTPRKGTLLACSVVRRVLHLLPTEPFHEAVDFAERNQVTEADVAVLLWQQRLDDEESAARDAARESQREVVKGCDPDADSSEFQETAGRRTNPAVPLYGASSRNAAEAVTTSAVAAGHAASAVRHLFGSGGATRWAVCWEAVEDAQLASAQAGVLASVALELKERADQIADSATSRNTHLLFSKASEAAELSEETTAKKFERLEQKKRDAENAAVANLLREQLGNPFRPYAFDPRWRTETVVALASGIEAERAFDRMPILADALEDAGCDDRPTLDHLRGPGPHARGCWVLDLILDREPELFALPPLVPTPRRTPLGPFTPPPDDMA